MSKYKRLVGTALGAFVILECTNCVAIVVLGTQVRILSILAIAINAFYWEREKKSR